MKKQNLFKLTLMAMFIAVILLMAFTPIGYIKTLGVEITLIPIIVAVGAIILGPAEGAFLGGVFGLTSFGQCFGMSPFGTALLGINPVFTYLLCIIPRVLMGIICAWIFASLKKIDKTKLISYAVASLSCAAANTIIFVAMFVLMFGRTDFFIGLQGGSSLLAFMAAFVGLNGIVEITACLIVGTALAKALDKYVIHLKAKN